jgi:hypothetical protein
MRAAAGYAGRREGEAAHQSAVVAGVEKPLSN